MCAGVLSQLAAAEPAAGAAAAAARGPRARAGRAGRRLAPRAALAAGRLRRRHRAPLRLTEPINSIAHRLSLRSPLPRLRSNSILNTFKNSETTYVPVISKVCRAFDSTRWDISMLNVERRDFLLNINKLV